MWKNRACAGGLPKLALVPKAERYEAMWSDQLDPEVRPGAPQLLERARAAPEQLVG